MLWPYAHEDDERDFPPSDMAALSIVYYSIVVRGAMHCIMSLVVANRRSSSQLVVARRSKSSQ